MKIYKTTILLKGIFFTTLLINLFATSTALAVAEHPRTLINASELTAIKAKVAANEEPWKSAYDKMIGQAKSALTIPAPYFSVTFGGDNSANANCANVRIFCTGNFYGGGNQYDALSGAHPVAIAVRDLGMAYALTPEGTDSDGINRDDYADKLITLIRTWALDSTTGMLPQFSNNQSNISLYPTMSSVIYGVDMAWSYPGWVEADKTAFKAWVQTFGNNARANGIPQSPQNFVNWQVAFVSMAGAFVDDQSLLTFAYSTFREIIPGQMTGQGRMGRESGRPENWGGIGYSVFALHAMTQAAEIARHQGVDLYNYTSTGQVGGKGLKLALDYHVPYLKKAVPGGNPFTVGPNPLLPEHGMGIYELAYSRWQEPAYLELINFWGRPFGMRIWALGEVTLTHANQFELDITPTAPTITAQPEAVTATEGEDVTFTVTASGSMPTYQWFRSNVAIEGATTASYTLTEVTPDDGGRFYHVVITNDLDAASSDPALLTVLADTQSPTLLAARAASDTRVDIVFSEAISASSAETIANYQVDPDITVNAANLMSDGRTVSLTVSPLSEETTYTVSISNVQDRALTPNTIATLSDINFTYRLSDGFEDGNADGWTPLNADRWEVTTEADGNRAYALKATGFGSPGGGRLGEYSLLPGEYGDFTFTAKAKLGSTAANADYAVLFGFQDQNVDSYYYVMFNNNQNYTQLFKVVNGTRAAALATATQDWLNDNAYHNIEVSRAGNAITVKFDGNVILSATDNSLGAGRVGVGSFNDAAYFDDVSLSGAATSTPDTTPPVITLIGDNPLTIMVGSTYVELGASASDNRDGNLSANITIDASQVNTAETGNYSVTYNVSDAAGNAAIQVTRTINVVATTATISDPSNDNNSAGSGSAGGGGALGWWGLALMLGFLRMIPSIQRLPRYSLPSLLRRFNKGVCITVSKRFYTTSNK